MRDLFHKAKFAVEQGGSLQREHVLDLVNTIMGRHRVDSSLWQVMVDFMLSLFPFKWIQYCKGFLSDDILKRRRIYHKANNMLNK